MEDFIISPDIGPEELPTPALPDLNQPASPDEGPLELPTPALPAEPQPPQITIPIRRCPYGYGTATVQNGQTFTDLLLLHNVSWQAMRSANPTLPTTRLSPGTRYCVPPQMTRRICPSGSYSYVMSDGEDLSTLSQDFGLAPGLFLSVNTQLAPSDFTGGRVICVP